MKISKKILANKVRKLEVQNYDMRQKIKKMDELLTYLDGLTTELNHALPDPEYDAKCEAVADVEASLDRHRERLGLDKPQLKQLDQSVFDGLDEKWRFAAVDGNGEVRLQESRPIINKINEVWACPGQPEKSAGMGYDASNWQNSLIERDTTKRIEIMRQIKFKGLTEGGTCVYGDLVNYENGRKAIIGRQLSAPGYLSVEGARISPVKAETVGQFTGLADKNGVEIYEGDIVKWQAGFVSGNNAIIYNDGGFCIDSAFQDDTSIHQSYASNALEVIGNVHQNPELLEQKQ